MKKIGFLFTGMILVSHGVCQNFISEYDSLLFSKPKANTLYYAFPHPALTYIILQEDISEYQTLSKKQALNDLLLGLANLFPGSGITTYNEMDVIWELGAELECNSSYLNWRVTLICTGKLAKEREHVVEDDGTHWPVVTRTEYFDWKNNPVGLIKELQDTICTFYIIMNPREDPYLKPWSDEIYAQKSKRIPTKSENENYKARLKIPSIDYALAGQFRGHDFVLITHGGIRKSYFYLNGELACIFIPDVDDYRVRKQDRRMPVLLLDKSIPGSERPDWYRLAVMTRYLNSILENEKKAY